MQKCHIHWRFSRFDKSMITTNTAYQPEDVYVQHRSPHDASVRALRSVLLSHRLPAPRRHNSQWPCVNIDHTRWGHNIATVNDTMSMLTTLYNQPIMACLNTVIMARLVDGAVLLAQCVLWSILPALSAAGRMRLVNDRPSAPCQDIWTGLRLSAKTNKFWNSFLTYWHSEFFMEVHHRTLDHSY